MGDPKKKHKTYTTPKRPWVADNLLEELRTVGAYGLRNKRELWKAKTELSHFRGRARGMLSLSQAERAKQEGELISKLIKHGMVMENATLEDVLTLTVEALLERRLQTYIYRVGLVGSLSQARQLIAHGHIAIDGRKVTSPSYKVLVTDEESLDYAPNSPYANKDHPLRQELVVEEAVGGEPVE